MKDFGEILQDILDDFDGLNDALDMLLGDGRLFESEGAIEKERAARLEVLPIARSMTYARIKSIIYNIGLLEKCLQTKRPLKNIDLQNYNLERLASYLFETNPKVHYVLHDKLVKLDLDDLKQEYSFLLKKLTELNDSIKEYNEAFMKARIITMEEARKRAIKVREAAEAEFDAQMAALKESRKREAEGRNRS